MTAVKWIKICTDIFDDEKILLVESMPEADSIIVIWFKLLCMAGKQNNGGVFMLNNKIAYTDEMLSTIFRRPLTTIRLALNTFVQFEMIEIVNDTITIPNWGKHQSLDQLESKKEYMRNYMKGYREKQRLLTEGKPLCKTNNKANVSEADKEIDKDKEKEIDKESDKQKRKRFVPPSLEEVKAYCSERNNNVDAERFIDYYTSNGWLVGKNKMKDWKAAVRTWERNGYSGQDLQKGKGSFDTDDFLNAAMNNAYGKPKTARAALEREVIHRSAEKEAPKTAGEDAEVRAKMEELKKRLGQ